MRVRSASPPRLPKWVSVFGAVSVILLITSQALALFGTPPDRDMGETMKILYVHVPSAWIAFLAFGTVAFGSVMYLWKRDLRFDVFAAAAAELGTVLIALTIVQGSIWARPTWGVWWTWDPRLTTTAIMLLVYAGYLALRSFTDDEERRARWSAAVGIIGAINVPIVWYSVKWWRTIHQVQSTTESVDDIFLAAFLLNLATFTLFFVYLLLTRFHVAQLERAADARLEERAIGGVIHV